MSLEKVDNKIDEKITEMKKPVIDNQKDIKEENQIESENPTKEDNKIQSAVETAGRDVKKTFKLFEADERDIAELPDFPTIKPKTVKEEALEQNEEIGISGVELTQNKQEVNKEISGVELTEKKELQQFFSELKEGEKFDENKSISSIQKDDEGNNISAELVNVETGEPVVTNITKDDLEVLNDLKNNSFSSEEKQELEQLFSQLKDGQEFTIDKNGQTDKIIVSEVYKNENGEALSASIQYSSSDKEIHLSKDNYAELKELKEDLENQKKEDLDLDIEEDDVSTKKPKKSKEEEEEEEKQDGQIAGLEDSSLDKSKDASQDIDLSGVIGQGEKLKDPSKLKIDHIIGKQSREVLGNGQQVVGLNIDKEKFLEAKPDKDGNLKISLYSPMINNPKDNFNNSVIKIPKSVVATMPVDENGRIKFLIAEKTPGKNSKLDVYVDTPEKREELVKNNPNALGKYLSSQKEKALETPVTPETKYKDYVDKMSLSEQGDLKNKPAEEIKKDVDNNKEELAKNKDNLKVPGEIKKDGSKSELSASDQLTKAIYNNDKKTVDNILKNNKEAVGKDHVKLVNQMKSNNHKVDPIIESSIKQAVKPSNNQGIKI